MLKNGAGLVLLDALGHHVQNVVHDGSLHIEIGSKEDTNGGFVMTNAELKIEMTLNTLLGHGLGNALAVASLKLTGKQVAKPALQEWHDTAEEKEPYTPAGSPDTNTGAFSNRARVKAITIHDKKNEERERET